MRLFSKGKQKNNTSGVNGVSQTHRVRDSGDFAYYFSVSYKDTINGRRRCKYFRYYPEITAQKLRALQCATNFRKNNESELLESTRKKGRKS